ncbi:P-loop NTPase family protein [Aequorivita antarctica]|uniref:Phenylalanyl-tRNA synthetase subunit alpha n=1 Tax=Aequorivita antarctica TaxID=153266 RepID=A0A5C6Z3E9_9FLAO|nr:hypothetical protein [Aequorivita antarctica]TXD74705.1 hypothetical protein ESU54_00495 [Aequorivita antarctica]SRX72622.1 hypothetical protein AEQU3_00419 [Aequorivita antarctica]
MQKDIEIPKAENVHIVAIKEWDKDFTGQQWNIYLVNDREDEITTVLVMSRGKSEDRKTSTLRHGLGNIPSKTAAKVEFIPTEVLGFTNEYLVTFFAENKLLERKFIFEPNSISEENVVEIPVMESEGILAK